MDKIKKKTRKQQWLVDKFLNEYRLTPKEIDKALKCMSAYERADWAVSQSKSNWKERWI